MEDADEEAEQIISLLETKNGAEILDLCCGIGRHTLAFARKGFKLTGVDRTEEYLRIARAKSAEEQLQIEFKKADMREFSCPDNYDVVLNLFTSFGYFENIEDDRRVLENIYISLRPGGKVIIDLVGKEMLGKFFQRRDWTETDDGGFALEERQICDDWSWMQNRWILIKDAKTVEHRVDHRIYSAAELKGHLSSCGFRDIQAFGDLAGAPYDRDAKRLVVVGQK